MKKKIGKLSKKRKVVKRKEPNKIVKAIENVEKRIEQEKRHLERIK